MKLSELIEGRIKLNVPATNWEEAVRAAGALLESKGDISPAYTEAMVKVVRELGPYAVIAPGVALPHARPEDGVRRSCLGLVRLAAPVEFGNKANDPVDLVFPLGGTRDEGHLEVLAALAGFLSTPGNLEAIRKARTEEEVLSVFRQGERKEVPGDANRDVVRDGIRKQFDAEDDHRGYLAGPRH
ncbi:MAG TPA: PTS sugar transporter subunit IIA [Firmicutes bacterium]|nr:PTS sugar transporter subunit IIA [Candidatus Fermentithermobacillaceae bacterium]